MPVNESHFAILIGLSDYHPGVAPNLKGPANDVAAVRAWLVDPAGGNLPERNIETIISSNFSPLPGAPGKDKLDKAFEWLMSKRPPGGRSMRIGHRLYFYASGHGFSATPTRACLLSGDANDLEKRNISPSAWIEWLQDQGCFHEHVLWVDACMDRVMFAVPSPAPADPRPGSMSAAGPSFVAFAAPRPLKALEKRLPPGSPDAKWRGVFTWNLIEGLRGAAVNPYGLVTGRSLADWLRRSQIVWFSEDDRDNLNFAKSPAIVHDDEGLVFARGVERPVYAVTLKLPAGTDWGRVRLWSGHPPVASDWHEPAAGELRLHLPPGLYLAESERHQLRHGFAVLRPDSFELTETGAAVLEDSGVFDVLLNPEGEDPQIVITSYGWCLVDSGIATLRTRLPRGLYEIQVKSARQIRHQVILLDRPFELRPEHLPCSAVPLASAAPLPGSALTREFHIAAASPDPTTVHVEAGRGAEVQLMARHYSDAGGAGPVEPPWSGVVLRDAQGSPIVDLALEGRRDLRQDPFAVAAARLDPGAYELHFPGESGHLLAQSVIVPPGEWRVEIYLMRAMVAGASGRRPRLSLLMRRAGATQKSALDHLVERLAVALADERPALGDDLLAALQGKFDNPLLGILGGHLILMAEQWGQDVRPGRLDDVVRNLRTLVGADHPDVEVLSLYCMDPSLRRAEPIAQPPIYERSWRLLVEAAHEEPRLVPAPLWRKIMAMTATPPFLHWSPDPQIQRGIRKCLADAVFGPLSAQPPSGAVASSVPTMRNVADPAAAARAHG
ncbi:MAG: caspase family protein, partial [Pseudomonadota bacterium]|nr:caspase family protein [Pseudomonadota bacterium]